MVSGRRTVVVPITRGTSLYGTGEQPGPLRRNGTRRLIRTTDSVDYHEGVPALYQAHPWVLALRDDGSAFGVIVETTFPCEVDLCRHVVFRFDARMSGVPMPAVTIIERESPLAVMEALADLVGRMPLPPRWSLGFHQSRWSYEPASRVLEIAATFRRRWIPCDVIWLDIDYMDGFRIFTFDPHKFPDPAALNRGLHDAGFRTVWMIDPGVKAEPGYFVYDQGREGGHFVTDRFGSEYHGQVWPGPCAFPDFTRADTRAWWAGLYRDFIARGIDGMWNDMNEPAVFDQAWKLMPFDNRHRADADLGGPGEHVRYRNIYGMLMARATREGLLAARPDRRPFVLTRSNFLGGHRYAATWTGDNVANYTHLAWSISMILNLGLSGQPFCGPDIGGFLGNTSPELFARWMGIGALLPFARAHKVKDAAAHEPWMLGHECEHVCRLALERRYRLLPYLYTLFHESSRTGRPIARPLFFADPRDARLRNADDSFLLGDALLVRCETPERDGEQIPCRDPMPPGVWKPLELARESHRWLPTLFVREGALVPAGPVMQHVDQKPIDPLTLYCALDGRGRALGRLYEDAGDGFAFERGEYRLTTLLVHRDAGTLKVEQVAVEGHLPPIPRNIEVVEM
jgi:alpha-glucosidase